MLNSLLDLVVCGGSISICGADCGRWTRAFQDDDADLWKDLTLRNMVPGPRSPPVPKVVQFPAYSDDVSALNDNPYRQRNEGNECEGSYHDLELRVEVLDGSMDDFVEKAFPKNGLAVTRRLKNHPREVLPRDDDCDGSSYSSCKRTIATKSHLRQHTFSWQTDSTDATMQTQNRSIRSVVRAH